MGRLTEPIGEDSEEDKKVTQEWEVLEGPKQSLISMTVFCKTLYYQTIMNLSQVSFNESLKSC